MARPVTIVTGGSRGIGAATCLRLAADGHDLAVGYVRDASAAETVVAGVREVRAVAPSPYGRTRRWRSMSSGCSRRPRSGSGRCGAW